MEKKYFFITFAIVKKGAIAQSVEQRTENPCVPGSIPGGSTQRLPNPEAAFFIGTTLILVVSCSIYLLYKRILFI